MNHCCWSFGCSSCHRQHATGTQNHPCLQAASATAEVRSHTTLYPGETTKAGLWRMEQSWKSAAATSRVGSAAPDISPPRYRKGHRIQCSKRQTDTTSGTVQTLRRGRWWTETWWWWRLTVRVEVTLLPTLGIGRFQLLKHSVLIIIIWGRIRR